MLAYLKTMLLSFMAILGFASTAQAALPAGVDAAIAGAGTDATTALAAIMLVAVGIWALRRILRLFGR